MAELADAHDSKSCEEIHTGSIPVIGTNFYKNNFKHIEKGVLQNRVKSILYSLPFLNLWIKLKLTLKNIYVYINLCTTKRSS